MHNWLEGVLQYHARRRWGLEIATTAQNNLNTVPTPPDSDAIYIDPMEIDAEIDGLIEESSTYNDLVVSATRRRRRRPPPLALPNSSSGEETGDDDYIQPDDDSQSGSENDDATDVDPVAERAVRSVFDLDTLKKIRACIADVGLPSWMDRPPVNLGEKSHGKLKADGWYVLFAVILPLALVENWTLPSSGEHEALLLENFYSLVLCTHIVCSYSTTNALADAFRANYINYRRSSHELFPNSPDVPNHHFAMHIRDQLKFWGPLMMVSEFAGERMNGLLQRIKTNGRICKTASV